jgi:hypothetical protein
MGGSKRGNGLPHQPREPAASTLTQGTGIRETEGVGWSIWERKWGGRVAQRTAHSYVEWLGFGFKALL